MEICNFSSTEVHTIELTALLRRFPVVEGVTFDNSVIYVGELIDEITINTPKNKSHAFFPNILFRIPKSSGNHDEHEYERFFF